jgi:acyl-coenzyme A thioesterase PaaI-like protein
MMRIALITSRPGSLAEFRAGLETHGFRVEVHGDAWEFLRTGLKREWGLVVLDGVGWPVQSFLVSLLEADCSLPVAVVTDLAPGPYQAATDGLGLLGPLPPRPLAADVPPLLDRLRAMGALTPDLEAAQASLDTLKRQRHPHCVVCWDRHPFGLQVDYCVSGPDSVEGTFDCGKSYEGYAGILHGGIVSSLLDGAMVSCLLARGVEAYTVDLRVRYHLPVATGHPATIRASWLKSRGALQWLQASLEQDGRMCARARATFLLEPPGRRAQPVPARAGHRPAHPRTLIQA